MRYRPRRAPRRRTAPGWAIAALAVVAGLAAGCGGDGDPAPGPGTDAAGAGSTTTGAPTPEPPTTEAAPLGELPIAGGTDAEGQPLPPPLHAVASLVVSRDQPWWPYLADDLVELDGAATAGLVAELRAAVAPFTAARIPVGIELGLGPAAAICATDPALLDDLEAAGHVVGGHAERLADILRLGDTLDRCGRALGTVSGFGALVAPSGRTPDRGTAVDAMQILAVQDVHQLTGAVSPACEALGLAAPTHAYGTGADTAPWRSAWSTGNPCADRADARIVVVDQATLAPIGAALGGSDRIDAAAAATIAGQAEQALAYCADLRYRTPEELPAPGIVTWGFTVRLTDLFPAPAAEPPPEPDDAVDTTDPADGARDAEPDPDAPAADADPLTLLTELLAALGEPAADGRLVWTTAERVGATLRLG